MKDLLTILAALIPLIQELIQGYKKAKETQDEKKYMDAVRSGDIDSINRILAELRN